VITIAVAGPSVGPQLFDTWPCFVSGAGAVAGT
jgi:hypothetical protein